MNTVILETPTKLITLAVPRYVLLFAKQRIGPTIIDNDSECHNLVIYGFSDEHFYGRFIASSGLLLTPFPLVKTYLRDQLSDQGGALKLVAVDPVDSTQPTLDAVTMQAVLTAFEDSSTQLIATHRLNYSEATKAYRF